VPVETCCQKMNNLPLVLPRLPVEVVTVRLNHSGVRTYVPPDVHTIYCTRTYVRAPSAVSADIFLSISLYRHLYIYLYVRCIAHLKVQTHTEAHDHMSPKGHSIY
jgi:hypothetical protein